MTFREHEQAAEATRPTVRCAVVTLSDTRTEATDTSGQLIADALRDADPPSPTAVRSAA